MSEYWDSILEAATEILTTYGLKIIGGVVILVVGWIVAGWLGRLVSKAVDRSDKVDRTLVIYGGKVTRLAVLLVTVVAVLNNFGVATTSIVAFIGAMGLAVGLALRGTLANVASGVVLLVLRPFRVGEYVDIAGTMGSVEEIGLFATELKTFDGLYTLIPNSQVWSGAITNLTRNGIRRVNLVFGISYTDDMERALELVRAAVEADERVLEEPEPLIKVAELGDSSVNIWCRPWCKVDDFLSLMLDLTKDVKDRFDAEGITIPFPQRDVHFFGEEPKEAA